MVWLIKKKNLGIRPGGTFVTYFHPWIGWWCLWRLATAGDNKLGRRLLTKNHRLHGWRTEEQKWYRLVNRQDGASTFERRSWKSGRKTFWCDFNTISLLFITAGAAGPLHLKWPWTFVWNSMIWLVTLERNETPARRLQMQVWSLSDIDEVILVGGSNSYPCRCRSC